MKKILEKESTSSLPPPKDESLDDDMINALSDEEIHSLSANPSVTESNDEKRSLQVILPRKLRKELKVYCAMHEITYEKLIENMFRAYTK